MSTDQIPYQRRSGLAFCLGSKPGTDLFPSINSGGVIGVASSMIHGQTKIAPSAKVSERCSSLLNYGEANVQVLRS